MRGGESHHPGGRAGACCLTLQRIPCVSGAGLKGETAVPEVQSPRRGWRPRLRPHRLHGVAWPAEGATHLHTGLMAGLGELGKLSAGFPGTAGFPSPESPRQTETSWLLWLEDATTEAAHTHTRLCVTDVTRTVPTFTPHMHNTHTCSSHPKHNTRNTLAYKCTTRPTQLYRQHTHSGHTGNTCQILLHTCTHKHAK